MILHRGRYWNESVGSQGEIRLWGDDILMNGYDYSEDYEPTKLNLIVTPNNFK